MLLCCKWIFDRIKGNLAKIQLKNHQNVQKMHFLQKVPGVNGLMRSCQNSCFPGITTKFRLRRTKVLCSFSYLGCNKLQQNARVFHSWAARSTWSPRCNFAAVDFEMSPLVVIMFCNPSRESEVYVPSIFLVFHVSFDGNCGEYAVKVIFGNRPIYW